MKNRIKIAFEFSSMFLFNTHLKHIKQYDVLLCADFKLKNYEIKINQFYIAVQ